MLAKIRVIRIGGNRSPWANAVLRLLAVFALVAALALAGTAVAEYRVLHAVTMLPEAGYEKVLSLECPELAIGEEDTAGAATSTKNAGSFANLRLAGFSCAIPLTPD